MSIFISIASYQDPLLTATMYSAYINARNKNDLIFSICDQSDKGINISGFEFTNQIYYEHVDPQLSRGPCWARSRAQKIYTNEDYFLQIDSHTLFDTDWDIILINQLKKISLESQNNSYFEKPIITSYPRPFNIIDFKKGKFELDNRDKHTQIIAFREDSLFSCGSFSRQIGIPTTNKNITHAMLIAAGFIFTKGTFIEEIPYDPNYYFYGEELSMALRSFTKGYSFFHIPDVPLFHLYTDVSELRRKLHWDQEDDKNRAIKWKELDNRSLNRLDALFAGNVEEPLNLGTKRSLEDYAFISGMDLKNNLVLDFDKATKSNFLESLNWKISPLE